MTGNFHFSTSNHINCYNPSSLVYVSVKSPVPDFPSSFSIPKNLWSYSRIQMLSFITDPGYTILENGVDFITHNDISYYRTVYRCIDRVEEFPLKVDWAQGKGQMTFMMALVDRWGNMEFTGAKIPDRFKVDVEKTEEQEAMIEGVSSEENEELIKTGVVLSKVYEPNVFKIDVFFYSDLPDDFMNKRKYHLILSYDDLIIKTAHFEIEKVSFDLTVMRFRAKCLNKTPNPTPIMVSRSQILSSLLNLPNRAMNSKITVRFMGEKAIDVGGPSREFFDLLGQCIKTSEKCYLFRPNLFTSKLELSTISIKSLPNLYEKLGQAIANSFKYGYFIGTTFNSLITSILFTTKKQDYSDIAKKISERLSSSSGKLTKKTQERAEQAISQCVSSLMTGFVQSMGSMHSDFITTFSEASSIYFLTGSIEQADLTASTIINRLKFEGVEVEKNARLFKEAVGKLSWEGLSNLWRCLTGSSSVDALSRHKSTITFFPVSMSEKQLIVHTCSSSMDIVNCSDVETMDMILSVMDCGSGNNGFNIA